MSEIDEHKQLEAEYQKILKASKKGSSICPHCGRCRECGQPTPNMNPSPYYSIPRYHPQPPNSPWTVIGSTTDTSFLETGFPNLSRNT